MAGVSFWVGCPFNVMFESSNVALNVLHVCISPVFLPVMCLQRRFLGRRTQKHRIYEHFNALPSLSRPRKRDWLMLLLMSPVLTVLALSYRFTRKAQRHAFRSFRASGLVMRNMTYIVFLIRILNRMNAAERHLMRWFLRHVSSHAGVVNQKTNRCYGKGYLGNRDIAWTPGVQLLISFILDGSLYI